MTVTQTARIRVMSAAPLAFAFVTSACGAPNGLDGDFHEVDCFRNTCADGSNDGTLTEASLALNLVGDSTPKA